MMYLYNGHRAPGLPVYDPGELPYGLIVSANADNTALILMLCVNRPYYGTNPSDSTKTGVYNTGRMLVYTCTDTDDAWTFSMETENPLTANDDDPGGGVLWTLEDILKTDGSVWMAGTQPVPERVSEAWVRSFQEGLALGLTGAPLPYTGTAEPVAYLYNGVRLPKVPEWDKTKYPYAYIRYAASFDYYIFFAFAQRPYADIKGNGYLQVYHTGDYFYTCHGEYCDTPDDWREPSESSYSSEYAEPPEGIYIWADFDIINEDDGSVFFAKRPDPIPVYE